MRWSTHEIREARSKLSYVGRLKFLPQESYARRMYYHIRYQGSKTGWMKRIKTIDSKYSGGTTRHLATTERGGGTGRNRGLEKDNAEETEPPTVQETQEGTSALSTLPGRPSQRAAVPGSNGLLLAQRRRFELYGEDPNCGLCGGDEETVEHVSKQCSSIDQKGQSALQCSVEQALGYGDEAEEGGGDDGQYETDELRYTQAVDSARPLQLAVQTASPLPAGSEAIGVEATPSLFFAFKVAEKQGTTAYQMRRSKCASVIKNVLGPHFKASLALDIGDSYYSLVIDESADKVNKPFKAKDVDQTKLLKELMTLLSSLVQKVVIPTEQMYVLTSRLEGHLNPKPYLGYLFEMHVDNIKAEKTDGFFIANEAVMR
ncbi:hypothetical protein HPB47_017057 [Ixodes persulcatus]|uniref:Uncharacterized protein n=1 Tax=Ixodes persulcatus TaxID=34615 RepID=A0AC60QRV0_IXOPE|nr:hypothetical protein HPB47_017057 [Ixodes persulcatus]